MRRGLHPQNINSSPGRMYAGSTDTVIYDDVWNNAYMTVAVTPNGIKDHIILTHPIKNASAEFLITALHCHVEGTNDRRSNNAKSSWHIGSRGLFPSAQHDLGASFDSLDSPVVDVSAVRGGTYQYGRASMYLTPTTERPKTARVYAVETSLGVAQLGGPTRHELISSRPSAEIKPRVGTAGRARSASPNGVHRGFYAGESMHNYTEFSNQPWAASLHRGRHAHLRRR